MKSFFLGKKKKKTTINLIMKKLLVYYVMRDLLFHSIKFLIQLKVLNSVAPKPNRTEITEKFTEPKCFGFGSALILFYRSIRFSVRLQFYFTEIFGFRFGCNFILPKFSVFGSVQFHFTENFGFRFGSNLILPKFSVFGSAPISFYRNFRFLVRF